MNNNTRTMDINTEATEMHKILKDSTVQAICTIEVPELQEEGTSFLL